jgi:hypothetical protein
MAYPPAPLSLDRDDQGWIVGGRSTDPAGRPTDFSIERRSEADHSIATARFRADGAFVLAVTSEISVQDEFISLEIADESAEESGPVLWWRLNFVDYDAEHVARAQVFGRGLGEFSGVYDPRIQRGSLQLIPDMWLSEEQIQLLERFRPAFLEMVERLQQAVEPERELINFTITNSRWSALGRVACRAFAIMATTAMGIAMGGPVGAVVGAGVGSVASDLCSNIR